MTGTGKQPPPPHVLNAGQTAGRLARTWNWKLIIFSAFLAITALWWFENTITTWAKNWYHSRAANPNDGGMPEIPPENTAETRRTYDMLQAETEQKIEQRVQEEVKKQVEEKTKDLVKTETAKDEGPKEPTLEERARDGEISGKVILAKVLEDPDGAEAAEEGGDDFGGMESNGVIRTSLASRRTAGGGRRDKDGSEFQSGFDCQVDAGTPIRVRITNSIDTARGGPAMGKVVGHVYDTKTGTCLAIPDGSDVFGDVKITTVKHQKAAEVTFTTLTRPYPRGDTLSFPMPASDSMGRAGVEGTINSNIVTNIALTALATGVELLPSLVTPGGGGSFLGSALGSFLGSAETPLNRAAREQFERPSTIELDQNDPEDRRKSEITVILRRHINADDFRSAAAPQDKNANKRRTRG